MAVVAVVAVTLAVLRALSDFFGFGFLFFFAVNVALFVYIPILVIVELLFFVLYFPLRRKRRERVETADRTMAPGSPESGEADKV
jgi:hypothetical protein